MNKKERYGNRRQAVLDTGANIVDYRRPVLATVDESRARLTQLFVRLMDDEAEFGGTADDDDIDDDERDW